MVSTGNHEEQSKQKDNSHTAHISFHYPLSHTFTICAVTKETCFTATIKRFLCVRTNSMLVTAMGAASTFINH